MTCDTVDVSVVIPAYNAADTIGAAVRSALNQTFTRTEVLVVDDGSTDDTSAVVESLILADPRVRLLRQANAGVGAARNAGIRIARGAYIAPLDADDTWEPEKLERQVRRIEECGMGCGMVYCGSNLVDAGHRWLARSPFCGMEGQLRQPLLMQNLVGNASVPLFRTAAFHAVGPYLERSEQGGAQGCEDWDLSVRLAERFTIGAVREPLVNYRQINSSMTLSYGSMAKSYETLLKRARVRNADLPETIFRRSAGRFYSYLARKCYRWSNYAGCVHCILRALRADPLTLPYIRLGELVAKSIVWSAVASIRGDLVPRCAPVSPPGSAGGISPGTRRNAGVGNRLPEASMETR